MSALKHTHTYRRSKARKNLYQCADPACSHYADRKFIVGKLAKCPDCEREYILSPYHLKLATPKCNPCLSATRKDKDRIDRTRLALKDLFPNDTPAPPTQEEVDLIAELTKILRGGQNETN